MEIKLKDKVYLNNCPNITGTVLGMHCEDFSKDVPVLVKDEQRDKILVIPYSQLKLVEDKEK